MNVLYVNTYYYCGGAEKVMRQLYEGMQSEEVNVYALVGRWQADLSADVTVVYHTFADRLATLIQGKIFGSSLHFASKTRKEIIRIIQEKQIDIVHFHNIHGMYMRVEDLDEIRKYCPNIVITLHDMWTLTGSCAYAFDCKKWKEEKCRKCAGNPSMRKYLLARRQWKTKEKELTEKQFHFITPSDWLLECCRQGLLHGEDIARIYNGINLTTYRPKDKNALRAKYGLPLDKKLLLFAASGTRNVYKGFPILQEALGCLNDKDEYALIVVGNRESASKLQVDHEAYLMGFVNDEDKMADLYAVADLFVLPSVADNLPFTAMEAMASGTPVIAFRIGGIPEIVGDAGWIVGEPNAGALAEGIESIFKAENQEAYVEKLHGCRQRMEEFFDEKLMIQNYLEVYRQMMRATSQNTE